jgi:hypothetical protein
VFVAGLPFACANVTNLQPVGAIGAAWSWATAMPNLRGYIAAGASRFTLLYNATNAAIAAVAATEMASGSGQNNLFIACSYTVT